MTSSTATSRGRFSAIAITICVIVVYPKQSLRCLDRRRDVVQPAAFGREECLAAGLGQRADAENVALALGDGDDAADVEQVEDVARLDRLVVGGKRQLRLDAAAAFLRGLAEAVGKEPSEGLKPPLYGQDAPEPPSGSGG